MRDPWLPTAWTLIVILTVWLGILGPMPDGFTKWLQGWQTLVAAMVALGAAGIAYYNTRLSLRGAAELEAHRRARKHAAVRASLSEALVQIDSYAAKTAQALDTLIGKCVGETLPAMTADESLRPQYPNEALATLSEFIEYADILDVSVIENVVARIQVHDSRLRSVIEYNNDPSGEHMVFRTNLEGYIVDAAAIYAGAAIHFSYARRLQPTIPSAISWDNVRGALRNMRFWDEYYPRIWSILNARERVAQDPLAFF